MSETTTAAGSDFSRRDFLKAAGFTFAGALLSGCQRAPEQEAIPPLSQPEGIVAGQAAYYASTCDACRAGCGMLVKCYDSRPIKLEGTPEHPLSKGGLCAAGQASLLGLYDRLRLQHPLREGRKTTWGEIDRDILGRLRELRGRGGLRVLTGTVTSPTLQASIDAFLDRMSDSGDFPDARQVVYDPVSCSAILDAHKRTHGARVLPRYHLERAEVIASFDADFLGPWLSPVEFTRAYRAGRPLTGNPPRSSYHVQVEARLSLTGSKADERVCVAPEEMGAVLAGLAVRLAKQARVTLAVPAQGAGEGLPQPLAEFCEHLATRLWKAPRGHSLVLCGSQDVSTQVVCNFVNDLLGNYGATLDVERPSLQRQGSDGDLKDLLDDLNAGKIAALFILDSNPVYDLPDLPNGKTVAQTLGQSKLLVCCTERLDETARLARYVCSHPHYLESWGDAEVVSGIISLRQPTILRLGDTRPVVESLDAWTGIAKRALPVVGARTVGLTGSPPGQGPLLATATLVTEGMAKPAYELLREHWTAHVFSRQTKERDFQAFWDRSVHDGYAEVNPVKVNPVKVDPVKIRSEVQAALQTLRSASVGRTLVLYSKVGLPDGSHAYNPWLQELPDPISKATWDNYACLSSAAAAEVGVSEGDVVRVEVRDGEGRGRALELPVLVQPGQHDRVVAVALGYGSIVSERFAGIGPPWLEARPTVGENGLVGQNAAALLTWEGGTLRYTRGAVELTNTGRTRHPLAVTQIQNTLTLPAHLAPPGHEHRPLVQKIGLSRLRLSPHPQPLSPAGKGEKEAAKPADLWPADHPFPEHRWGMVIDLSACTGCSACVIACQAENNVPVVGRDEVRRHREMHWLRIDRYYSSSPVADAPGSPGVEVDHQPMLCHHCERAPCETVCPVLATVHSEEGLNEQVYNRCVGTRYCANNCPYKVRRFNWFAYAHDDMLQNLALNPDVTVRSRGVMEKCTFCVQRIQEAKIAARQRGEKLHDGDIQTACQQSCPAGAIVFGDLKNPASRVARLQDDPRHYHTLAELNIGPAVGYLKVVRNRPEGEGGQQHG
jgi:molybdopterin-containing oxidoreductase family iron-sulfur binding subunit